MTADPTQDWAGLLEDLANPDEEIRRLAVERLSSLSAREAIPRLVEVLGDPSWRVRKAAVERLVSSTEAEVVAHALIGALADGDNPGRRNSAVEALMACGRTVVPHLVDALATDDIDVRKLVVDALAGIGDASARGALIRTLSDADPNVRGAAADALGVLGGEEAEAALRRTATASREDRLVRFSALRALARLECSVRAAELEGVLADPVLRPAALALLGYCEDDGASDLLLKGLGSPSRGSREAAMHALLVRLGREDTRTAELSERIRRAALETDGLVASASRRIAEADLATRLMLVQFLGLVGTTECVVPILESGRDEALAEVAHATLASLGEITEEALERAWASLDCDLRRSACSLLARTGGTRASRRLAEALADPDALLRTAAARALGARRCDDSLPDLVRRLESAALDEEPEAEEEREAITGALARMATPDAPRLVARIVELLAPRLGSPQEPVRRAAATVMAAIARKEDAEQVIGLLRDPSAEVRRLAVGGLLRLDPEAAARPMRLALADEAPLVRVAAASSLGASSAPGVLDDLRRLLVDDDPRVAAAAVRGIGSQCAAERAPDPAQRAQALALLAEPLSRAGRGGMLAMAALEALEAIGGPEAGQAALAALGSAEPEVAQAAVACIGRHGDAATVAELIGAVSHPFWAVRGEAIQTLAERRVSKALPAILRRLETEQDSFVRDVILRALRQLEE